jgi:DNA anti-recombination protein RmuC
MKIRMPLSRPVYLTAAVAALVALPGCGEDSSSGAEEHESATPQEAIVQIGEVRTGLAAALAAYRAGDAEKADELVGDAYLEHFELVEAPLEERDEELNEELEELIRTEIRQEIEDDARVSAVAALVREANAELDQAEKALKG